LAQFYRRCKRGRFGACGSRGPPAPSITLGNSVRERCWRLDRRPSSAGRAPDNTRATCQFGAANIQAEVSAGTAASPHARYFDLDRPGPAPHRNAVRCGRARQSTPLIRRSTKAAGSGERDAVRSPLRSNKFCCRARHLMAEPRLRDSVLPQAAVRSNVARHVARNRNSKGQYQLSIGADGIIRDSAPFM
jgi:hypothetical protein